MQERNYKWTDISEDLIPYLAKNQFKEALHKYYLDANKEKHLSKDEKDFSARIVKMMNPNMEINSDYIKILAYIDP